jgi:magnesium chelatase family protein
MNRPAPGDRGYVATARALVGMDSPRVTVETHLPGGLPGFTLVGLPETAVREARDRVKSAIQNCGLDYPRGKVVVNLAPAELTKEGARFDLAIAVSILRATGQLPRCHAGDLEFVGELGLYGELRATRGCLCAALELGREDPGGNTRLIVPADNAGECRAVPAGMLLTARHLAEVVAFLRDPQANPLAGPEHAPAGESAAPESYPRLEDVVGQPAAKRALAIAAAGEHHLLLSGPPGTGKTLLARRLTGLLPDLERHQAMEIAAVYSAAGLPGPPPGRPPMREPHHSASAPALVGGGRDALPGEISLAHHGVLLLDELPLFKPSVLDLLREPLESRRIILARARYRASFPAAFQLVGAMNPCPAGQVCSDTTCRCSPDQVRRYRSRVSGPLLDRIDLHVTVPPLEGSFAAALDATETTSTAEVRAQVAAARERQRQRQGCSNGALPATQLKSVTALEADARRLLERASDGFALSMRGLHRVLRIARSIADLEGSSGVTASELAEALSYRDSSTM